MSRIGRIGFIGGGKIAQAMAKGFISAGMFKKHCNLISMKMNK